MPLSANSPAVVNEATADRSGAPVEPEAAVPAAPASNGSGPSRATALDQRPAPDRFMRRLLRVHGPPVPGAIFGAQGFMSRSIVVSAIRCTITYLLVPILTPIVGVLNVVDVPLSIALLTFALVWSTRGLRRFWVADHPKRWAYTAMIAAVWVLLVIGLGTDIARLV